LRLVEFDWPSFWDWWNSIKAKRFAVCQSNGRYLRAGELLSIGKDWLYASRTDGRNQLIEFDWCKKNWLYPRQMNGQNARTTGTGPRYTGSRAMTAYLLGSGPLGTATFSDGKPVCAVFIVGVIPTSKHYPMSRSCSSQHALSVTLAKLL